MPRMVTGAAANGAMAAKVGAVSLMAVRSASMPASARGPCTVTPAESHSTWQPIRRSTSRNPRSPCSESRRRPGTRTRPPVTAAAAKK